MSRIFTLTFVAILCLTGCNKADLVKPTPNISEVVAMPGPPVVVKTTEKWYVPIDSVYTTPLIVARYPLWQCPLERDELRSALDLANVHRNTVRSIEGTKKEGAP